MNKYEVHLTIVMSAKDNNSIEQWLEELSANELFDYEIESINIV